LERTLVLIKPDGVQRGLVGEIIRRLECRGLKVIAAKFLQVDKQLAERHYAIHRGQPFYDGLIQYITSAPVMAMVWEGVNAIQAVRQTMGATRPTEAAPGSIRHDFGLDISRNLTHASDSQQTASEEIALWFDEGQLVPWSSSLSEWIYEK
jgi:nucleoside-diphosphate kinase